MANVRVALAQTQPKIGDVAYNLQQCVSFIEKAAVNNADLVVFPELYFTGYNLQELDTRVHTLSDEWLPEIHRTLCEVSKANNIYVIVGLCEQIDGEYYNTARLYGRNGELVGTHKKIFLFELERNYFSRGTEFKVFDTDFGRLAMLICYDIGFPETARKMALLGADLLVFPAAWCERDCHSWLLNVPSRALENQVYSVGVNHAGHFGDVHLCGSSLVSNPDGRIALQLGHDEPQLAFCDIDMSIPKQMQAMESYRYDFERTKVF